MTRFGTLLTIVSLFSFCYSYNSPIYIKNLARENYKLVPYFAKKYMKNKKLTYDEKNDMIQEGYIGLMYACRKYDERYGVKFSTYSSYWIHRYIINYLKQNYNKKDIIEINDKVVPSYDHICDINFDLLTKKEKDIIYKRYFQYEKMKDIANEYKVCRNTMTNWMQVAIEKLKLKN